MQVKHGVKIVNNQINRQTGITLKLNLLFNSKFYNLLVNFPYFYKQIIKNLNPDFKNLPYSNFELSNNCVIIYIYLLSLLHHQFTYLINLFYILYFLLQYNPPLPPAIDPDEYEVEGLW